MVDDKQGCSALLAEGHKAVPAQPQPPSPAALVGPQRRALLAGQGNEQGCGRLHKGRGFCLSAASLLPSLARSLEATATPSWMLIHRVNLQLAPVLGVPTVAGSPALRQTHLTLLPFSEGPLRLPPNSFPGARKAWGCRAVVQRSTVPPRSHWTWLLSLSPYHMFLAKELDMAAPSVASQLPQTLG